MGIMLLIILSMLCIGLIFYAFSAQSSEKSKAEENKRIINKPISSFNSSVEVVGVNYSYIFSIDNQREKILYKVGELDTIFNFDEIIGVEIVADETVVSKKTASRTIGGTIVGGILAGGAGSIVGGLTGDSTQTKKILSVKLKILTKSIYRPSIEIICYDRWEMPILINDGTITERESSEICKLGISHANKIKDLVGVIIDKVDSRRKRESMKVKNAHEVSSISDELLKLHDLKEKGILTESEFSEQKIKLLSK